MSGNRRWIGVYMFDLMEEIRDRAMGGLRVVDQPLPAGRMGGDGHIAMLEDQAHLAWLREQKNRVQLMTSVCTGSVVFAAAGLLRGRPATSNRNSLDHMKSIDATIDVRRGQRFVDDGDIVTAGGLSAGPERARQVRVGIEYAPA